MVVAPGRWEPGINCERELREFSGGDGAVLYPDGSLSCTGVCTVKNHPVVHLSFVHFIVCIDSKISIISLFISLSLVPHSLPPALSNCTQIAIVAAF